MSAVLTQGQPIWVERESSVTGACSLSREARGGVRAERARARQRAVPGVLGSSLLTWDHLEDGRDDPKRSWLTGERHGKVSALVPEAEIQ